MEDPEPNHNGGLMVFGPDKLCTSAPATAAAATTSTARAGNAQSLSSPLGKILRIDPRASGGRPYTIPASNPFVGRAGARGEIYSYGLRNPWRFSFDRANGNLVIGDVGQDAVEEIDFVRAAARAARTSAGGPGRGGATTSSEPAPGAVFPVITHTHGSGFCSITGGYVVRDRACPALYGRYVYGDLCNGRLRVATLRAGRAASRTLSCPRSPASRRSARTPPGASTSTSLNGPVYRFAAR